MHPKIKSELLLDPDRLEKLWERHGRSISNDFHVRKKFQIQNFCEKIGAVQKKTFSFLTTEALVRLENILHEGASSSTNYKAI